MKLSNFNNINLVVGLLFFFIGFKPTLGRRSDYQCTRYNRYGKSGGKCIHTAQCPGRDYKSWLCPSFSRNIKCCFSAKESSSFGYQSDSQCTRYNRYGKSGGKCVRTSQCPARDYKSWLCPNYPMNVKCCFSLGSSNSGSSSDSGSGSSSGSGSGRCNSVRIISRSEWGARRASTSRMRTPVKLAFVHHTAGSRCFNEGDCKARARDTQNYHMNTKGWSDIGYSFLIGEDGNAYEGRGWQKQGAHTYGYNSKSLGFSMMGNFESVTPTQAAVNALKNLLQCGIELGYLSADYTVAGHRNVKSTLCPGQKMYNIIKTWSNFNSNV